MSSSGLSRSWSEVPADTLAYIINDCSLAQSDVAAVRLTCSNWRQTSHGHLKHLAPACTSLEQVASLEGRFPYLTAVDLTRCDTRLVGHASLCRDASARLSTLLSALARMPSLTCLHISDTFSERMGQKFWAALVCAQALMDHVEQPEAASSSSSPSLEVSATVAAAKTAALMMTPADAGKHSGAAEGPAVGAIASFEALVGDSNSEGGADADTQEPQARDAPATPTNSSGGSHTLAGGRAAAAADEAEAEIGPVGEGQQPLTPVTGCTGGSVNTGGVQPCDPGSEAAQAKMPGASTVPAAQLSAGPAAARSPPAAPATPPQPLVISAAELADPGIKSFARAIARPGATHQHAFWLPDWCGTLSGLQEVHVRGRQRPSSGLPPCLLWLHAGRTAPQLTSLTLVRLSLTTLPEQLQHLTGLTRLVAQDCSLSLMPTSIAVGLSRLEYMDLSLNGLTSLPADFTQLTSLRHLDLQRNKLAALPADIGRLSALTCLLLNNNQLRQLPTSLSSLRSVEHLSCSYNWLGGMPSLPLLCGLPRLRRLELACVSDVRCRLVPPQELRLLAAHLTHLDLAANNLVPSDVLGTLTSLRSLVLSDCGLLAVPPWVRRLQPCLQHLDLSTNSLAELPPWLSACSRLRFLSIAHNRLSIRVPPSVLEQMPQLSVVESE